MPPPAVARRDPARLMQLRKALVDPDMFGSIGLVILLDEFGLESIDAETGWHPATLRQEAQETFLCKIPDHNWDKIMAAITILTTDQFFQNLISFAYLVNSLTGGGQTKQFPDNDPYELSWAVLEALMLAPPEDEQNIFMSDIPLYIGKVLEEYGIVYKPKTLSFAVLPDRSYDFSDDPEMFNAIEDNQRSKSDDIDQNTESLFKEYLEQLADLPLHNGNAKKYAQKFQQAG